MMSGSGRTILEGNALLDIPSQVNLVTRTLENGGTVFWAGGTIALNNSVVTNRPGSLFDAQGAGNLGLLGGSPRFDNAGTFRKSVTAGTLTVGSGVSFNNSGTVEIQAGTWLCTTLNNDGVVNLSAGTTNRLAGEGSATGAFTAPTSALVEWTGGTFTLNSPAQLNGSGLYRLNGGSVNADRITGTRHYDQYAPSPPRAL